MKKVISGKTILLNNVTNCTFIANDDDIEILKKDFKHIEWAGELDIAVTPHQYRTIAEQLWMLLDEIDTYSDMCKPSDKKSLESFYKKVMERQSKRHLLLRSLDNTLHIHPTYPHSFDESENLESWR